MDVKEEAILGPDIAGHWYYRSKGRALRAFLERPPRSILDVGAGSGVFSRLLLDAGAIEATCVDPAYATERQERHHGKPINFLRQVEHSAADLVLMMDVLEHVDDDAGLLRHYADLVERGTPILITVPAFQSLWSGHDVFLEHKRRYRLPEVLALARRAGLQPVKASYFFGLIFPLAALIRWLQRGTPQPQSDIQRHTAAVNGLLTAICSAELPLFTRNRLAGLTVFCLARTL